MRKFKKIFLLAFIFVAASAVIFGIAKSDESENIHEVGLYFKSSDEATLLLSNKKIKAKDDKSLYEGIADMLIKGPSDKKYSQIMDKNVKLNGVSFKNGRLTVDFSKEYDRKNLLCTYAVIKSFCLLDDVNSVRVSVCGDDITGFVTGDEINLESDDDCATAIKLYFTDSSKSKLVKEFRRINITDTQPIEQHIVSELIKGPDNEDFVKLLASDTGILSVETTDGTCYVNFKQDFIDKNSASGKEELIIYSVVNSLTERDNVKNVQFLIDGKKTEKFGNMKISELFYRNEAK